MTSDEQERRWMRDTSFFLAGMIFVIALEVAFVEALAVAGRR